MKIQPGDLLDGVIVGGKACRVKVGLWPDAWLFRPDEVDSQIICLDMPPLRDRLARGIDDGVVRVFRDGVDISRPLVPKSPSQVATAQTGAGAAALVGLAAYAAAVWVAVALS